MSSFSYNQNIDKNIVNEVNISSGKNDFKVHIVVSERRRDYDPDEDWIEDYAPPMIDITDIFAFGEENGVAIVCHYNATSNEDFSMFSEKNFLEFKKSGFYTRIKSGLTDQEKKSIEEMKVNSGKTYNDWLTRIATEDMYYKDLLPRVKDGLSQYTLDKLLEKCILADDFENTRELCESKKVRLDNLDLFSFERGKCFNKSLFEYLYERAKPMSFLKKICCETLSDISIAEKVKQSNQPLFDINVMKEVFAYVSRY